MSKPCGEVREVGEALPGPEPRVKREVDAGFRVRLTITSDVA